MNKRLEQFLAAENMSQTQFAETINVARASVSHLLAGRNNPGYDFIKSVMQKFPDLSIEWLILGKGKMYREQQQPGQQQLPRQDSLFSDEPADEANAVPEQESYISHAPVKEQENIEALSKIETSYKHIETQVKQRVVSKIIVFFDDGSYQELA